MLKNNEKELEVKSIGMLRMLDHIRMGDDVVDEEDEEEADDEEYMSEIKVRDASPSIEGGFWLAAVSAATGGNGSMEPGANCAAPESGFISSHPHMSEFILPHHADTIQGEDVSPAPNSNNGDMYATNLQDSQQSGVNVQEYAWMKEKKSSRKNNHQGKIGTIFRN